MQAHVRSSCGIEFGDADAEIQLAVSSDKPNNAIIPRAYYTLDGIIAVEKHFSVLIIIIENSTVQYETMQYKSIQYSTIRMKAEIVSVKHSESYDSICNVIV